jgi:hypothetical protein
MVQKLGARQHQQSDVSSLSLGCTLNEQFFVAS